MTLYRTTVTVPISPIGDRLRARARVLSSAGRHRGLIALAAVAVGILQFALIDRGGFWLDDFVNLAEARHLGLSLTLLVEPVYQHFAPGHRVLDWLVAVPFGESYTAAVLIMALFIAGAVVALALLLDECFGRRNVHVVLAAAAGSSWTLTDTSGWWAAAAHALPSIFFTQLALLFYVRWYRARRRADYMLALVVFVTALMFWELSLLFLIEAALLAALLLGPHDTFAAVARSLLRALPGLACFIVVGLVYVIYVSAQPWHQPFELPTGAALRQFTQILVLRGWLPPLVGTGTGFGPVTSFERAMQVLAGAGVLAGLAVAVVTRRAIVRACVFFAGTVLVVWFAVGGYRLNSGGVWVGDTSRLIAPLPFLFWFAVGFALQPAAGRAWPLLRRLGERSRSGIDLRRGTRWATLAGPMVVLTLAVPYALNLKHTDDVRWFGRLEGKAGSAKAAVIAQGVRIARQRGMLNSFVESPVPEPVAFPGRWDDTLWRMGAYFDRGIHAVGEGPLLLTIDPTGVVRENTFAPVALASGAASVACPAHTPCTARLVARSALPDQPAYVRVTLTTSGPTRLRLESLPAAQPQDAVEHRSYYDDTTRHLVLPAGRRTLVLALWASDVTLASVTATGSPVSLRAELGVLSPGAALN
jgi:hypothetical protein